MANYTYATVIIEIANQKAAQDLTSSAYFIAELSETGEAPATHCFMSGPFDNTEIDVLISAPFTKWIRSSDWQDAISGLNLKQIIEDVPVQTE